MQQIPTSIAAVADYEPFARERMSEAWACMAGGAADEPTLCDNCAAFRRLCSRALQDLTGCPSLAAVGPALVDR